MSNLLDRVAHNQQVSPAYQGTETNQATVAMYKTHVSAEEAVRLLHENGIPMEHLSIIGRDWQVREDVQGFYQPSDAMKEGAKQGAWFGGLFGLFMGIGMFIMPVAGAVFVLGPLAGVICGAIGGAGLGALVTGLISMGIPKDQALKYQSQLQAGEFLVLIHGPAEEGERAHRILANTSTSSLMTHVNAV